MSISADRLLEAKRRSRYIVTVDAERCIGCGECVKACLTGALQIINGVSQLIDERLCDGFGSCIAACKNDAIRLEYREAAEFDWSLLTNIGFNALMAKLRRTSQRTLNSPLYKK